MRGRKPKPTEQKRLEGNPGKRPLNPREPELPAPEPDETLPPELVGDVLALQEWARLEPMLRISKVLTAGDRGSLVALCQQWSRYLEATQKVAVSGLVIKAPESGYPMTNPYIGIANKCLSLCVKLWTELGLTPSARSRVTTSEAEPKDAFSEFDEPNPLAKYLKKGHRQTNHNARHQDGRTRGAALRRLQDEARRLRQPQPAFDDTDPEVRCG